MKLLCSLLLTLFSTGNAADFSSEPRNLTPTAVPLAATAPGPVLLPVLPPAALGATPPGLAAPAPLKAAISAAQPREAAALKNAWKTVRGLVESVPGAPDSIADASLEVDPGRAYQPSPEDWRDRPFYYIYLDRFARSGPGRPVGAAHDGDSRHGGNLRGVIEQLDYLKGLGELTLVLSPVTQTLPESPHGYAAINLLAVDPHLGTMADLKELVAEAHKRGMMVVLDWGINHAGPVFEYENGSAWSGVDSPPKKISPWTQPLKPVELARPENFTRRGVINDWKDPAQAVNGDFPPNYRHYDSARPETADILIHITNWWIKETGIDGLRLDAVRHVPPAFLPVFKKRVSAYAASLGKNNFFYLPEVASGNEDELTPFTQNGLFQSLTNYPAFRRNNKALHGQAPSIELAVSHSKSDEKFGDGKAWLVNFLDNHDTYRFLRVGEPLQILHTALTFLMTTMGIPIIYYGTEQAFRQGTNRFEPEGPAHPADPFNREDMFAAGLFKSPSSAGDKFDVNSETYLFLAKLAALRARFPALRRGSQWSRYATAATPGLNVYSRMLGDEEIVVVLNTSPSPQSNEFYVDAFLTPAGTELVDALDPGYKTRAFSMMRGGSSVHVDVPGHGSRILVHRQALQ